MERPAESAGYLKILILAWIMLLLPNGVLAQQEVSPDIYGDSATAVQKAQPVKQARKPSAPQPRTVAGPRSSRPTRKPVAERKLAASNRHKPIPAPLQ